MPRLVNAVPSRCHKITILCDPFDEDSGVELTLVDVLETTEESGIRFRRRILKFANVQDWQGTPPSRVEAVQKITHRKRFPGLKWKGHGVPEEENTEIDGPDESGPNAPGIKVYVPVEVVTKEASGYTFVRRRYGMLPQIRDMLRFRLGHVVRIEGENGDWLDIWRPHRMLTFEGSGPTFWRRMLSVLWEDPNPQNGDDFDDNELDADPPPPNPAEAVYRTDPLQRIVNISPGNPYFKITFALTISSFPGGAGSPLNVIPIDFYSLRNGVEIGLTNGAGVIIENPMQRITTRIFSAWGTAVPIRNIPMQPEGGVAGDSPKNLTATTFQTSFVTLRGLTGVKLWNIPLPEIPMVGNWWWGGAIVKTTGGIFGDQFAFQGLPANGTVFLTDAEVGPFFGAVLGGISAGLLPNQSISSVVGPQMGSQSDPVPFLQVKRGIVVTVTTYAHGRTGAPAPAIGGASLTVPSEGPVPAKKINITINMETLSVAMNVVTV